MITNTLIIYDFETSSTDIDTTQILSIGAVAVDPRKLEVIASSEFYSLVQPEDEKTVQPKALEVNKLTLDELRKAPVIDVVWKNFAGYVGNYGKTLWKKPIPGGFNISGFDNPICRRMNARFKTELWHPFLYYDVLDDIKRWTWNNPEIKSMSFDNIRKWMGMPSEGAHNALQDSKDAATLAIRFLKLYESIKPKFANSFGFSIKN